MNQKTMFLRPMCVILVTLGMIASAYAVTPKPLESAYWRFEEGTAGSRIPGDQQDNVLDSINANHMRRYMFANSPIYTTEVALGYIPATGASNTLALRFDDTGPDRDDIYATGKNICNPLIGGGSSVQAFTIEATFKADAVGKYMVVVCKESQYEDATSAYPPFALKIMAANDAANPGKLCVEYRDRANVAHSIASLEPVEANRWYHAAVVATTTGVSFYLSKNNAAGYVFQGTAAVTGGGPLYQGTADDYESAWSIGKGMWAQVLADWFDGVIDEVRITNSALNPCNFLFRPQPRIGNVLLAGMTAVTLADVHPEASEVKVYDVTTPGSPVLLGTNSSPGGNQTVAVTVSPALANGQVIVATQTIDGCEGALPPTGPTVGDCGQIPSVTVGMVDAGRTQVVIPGVDSQAQNVKVYANDVQIGINSSPGGAGKVIVPVTALVEGSTIKATQTISGLEGCLPAAGRRVTAAGVLEDFETVVTGTAPNTPVSPSQQVWYAVNDGITTVIANRTDINGTSGMAVTDHGWTNGVYAVYEGVFAAAGQYHLELQMWVDERGGVDTDFIQSYEVGVVVNGTHRTPGKILSNISTVGKYNGLLTAQQDGVGVEAQPHTVYGPTIMAEAGDSVLIAFSTTCGGYIRSKAADGGTYSGMLIDNIRINVGPKPCTELDVPPVLVTAASETMLLVSGATEVKVTGLASDATRTDVYAYTASPDNWELIGTATDLAGASSALVSLARALASHETIVATQTINLTDCIPAGLFEGAKPTSGAVVGTGKNSALKLAIGLREVAVPAGGCIPGTDGGNSGAIEWIGVTAAGSPPQGKFTLSPSNEWQTVTFDPGVAAEVKSFANGNGVLDGACYVLEHLALTATGGNSGSYTLYIDNISLGSGTVVDFEDGADAALYMFRTPNYSGTTIANLLNPPAVAEVTSAVYDGMTPGKSLKVKFQFKDEATSRWLRLTTDGATTLQTLNDPVVSIAQPITMRVLLQGVSCNSPFADADGDDDVDQADFAAFQACFTGSGGSLAAGCECFDRDDDSDVDADDMGAFETCASGSGIPADDDCDN